MTELIDAITPGNTVLIAGCGFGPSRGKVNLKLIDANQSFELPVQNWTDDLIIAYVHDGIRGVLDQKAELSVTNSNSVFSAPLEVDFIAARSIDRLDTDAHRHLVEVNPECYTAATRDGCGGISAGNPAVPGSATTDKLKGERVFCPGSLD